MTNEQLAALLFGIIKEINRTKYTVSHCLESADGNAEEAGRQAWHAVEDLESHVERQLLALYGTPPR